MSQTGSAYEDFWGQIYLSTAAFLASTLRKTYRNQTELNGPVAQDGAGEPEYAD